MRAAPQFRFGGAGLALVLLALIARLLVPQGTMVSRDARGPELVICTGHGPMTAPNQPSAPAKSRTRGDCAFSAHSGAAPLVDIQAGAGVPIAWTAPGPVAAAVGKPPVTDPAAPLPPPLGPPTVEG